jgi:hypothetical protein
MSNLQDLIRFTREHDGQRVMSAYVGEAPPDPAEREAWMLELRDSARHIESSLADSEEEERRQFASCVDRLWEEAPKEGTLPRTEGWACFVAENGDALSLTTPPGATTHMEWAVGPRLIPFLRLLEPTEALILQVDQKDARISTYLDGAVTSSAELEADWGDDFEPDRASAGYHQGKHGHAGTDSAQRHRRDATARLHSDAIRRAVTIAKPNVPILIGGAADSAQHLLESLPPAIAERAIVAPELRMNPAEVSLDAVRHGLREWHARMLKQRVASLREEAHPGGRGAAGYEAAREAAALHAIDELILSDSAWREDPDRIEALVRDALTHGAVVEWAEPETLATMGPTGAGIVAGLRFPLPEPPSEEFSSSHPF